MRQLIVFSVSLALILPAFASDAENHVRCNATSTTGGQTVNLSCNLPDEITKLRDVSITMEHYVNNEVKYTAECHLLGNATVPTCKDAKVRLQEQPVSNVLQVSLEGLANATVGSYVCKVMTLVLTVPHSNVHTCSLQLLTAVPTTSAGPPVQVEKTEEKAAVSNETAGLTSTGDETSSKSSNTLSIAIGVGVGVGVLLIIAVGVFCYLRRKKAASGTSIKVEEGDAEEKSEKAPFIGDAETAENGTKSRMSTEKSDSAGDSQRVQSSANEVEEQPQDEEKGKLLDKEQAGPGAGETEESESPEDGGPQPDQEPRQADNNAITPAKAPVPAESDN